MSCNQINMILPCVKTGKTWPGAVGSLSSTGTAFADALASVVMTFKNSAGTTELTLSSADGEITIDSAATWAFTVAAITPWALAAGYYSWEITTTDSAGTVKGYPTGEIETIN